MVARVVSSARGIPGLQIIIFKTNQKYKSFTWLQLDCRWALTGEGSAQQRKDTDRHTDKTFMRRVFSGEFYEVYFLIKTWRPGEDTVGNICPARGVATPPILRT